MLSTGPDAALDLTEDNDVTVTVPGLVYDWPVNKIWSADELMAISPAEREQIFLANSSTEIDDVPPAMLERARQKIEARIGQNRAASTHDT